MKTHALPYKNIITLKKNNQLDYVYDIELNNHEILKKYFSFECHIVVYPYSRKICSNDISFFPFEEYVKDIQSNQRSAYQKIISQFSKLFGIFLGLLIITGFYLFHPGSLLSIESILSLLGAYFIGKELWSDLENILIDLTKTWKIRYQPASYSYKLTRNSTLAFYSRLAKKNRYGIEMLLPEKMDFIQQSNSQTLRLFFKKKEIKNKTSKSMHIISLHISPELKNEFNNRGFMFGVKLSFHKSLFGLRSSREFFQSFDNNEPGCLDENGIWCDNSVFMRHTFSIGRIKFFLSSCIIENADIINKG